MWHLLSMKHIFRREYSFLIYTEKRKEEKIEFELSSWRHKIQLIKVMCLIDNSKYWPIPILHNNTTTIYNDVNVPRCHTENLSYEDIFFPSKYTLLLFSRFYFFGHKYKRRDFLWEGAFAPVAPPSATCLDYHYIKLQTESYRLS